MARPQGSGGLNVDSPGGISGAGTILDIVDPGAYLSGTDSLATSKVSTQDTYGRVTVQVPSGSTSLLPSLNLAGYIVDSTHIQLIETAGDKTTWVSWAAWPSARQAAPASSPPAP
jgi:hypothetical protein